MRTISQCWAYDDDAFGTITIRSVTRKKITIGSILICTPFVMHDSGIFARRYNEAMAGLKKKPTRQGRQTLD
jgi:hypothetical protein